MFSRKKSQQKLAPIKRPVRPTPKTPLAVPMPMEKSGDRQPLTARNLAPPPTDVPSLETKTNISSSEDGYSQVGVADHVSTVAKGMSVSGNVETTGGLRVWGSVEGHVLAGDLEVSKDGVINGNVRAEATRVAGTVNGNIHARKVALTATAQVNGDINHCALSIEAGAVFNGLVRRIDETSGGSEKRPTTQVDDSQVVDVTTVKPLVEVEKAKSQKLSTLDLTEGLSEKTSQTAEGDGK